MSEQEFGSAASGRTTGTVVLAGRPEPVSAGLEGQPLDEMILTRAGVAPVDVEDARILVRMAREQLARDIAAIEEASAALRRAEPALQSWSQPTGPASAPKTRPLWLLIGVLWLSTALVTVGAVVTIARLAG